MFKKFEGSWFVCNIENQFFAKCEEITRNENLFSKFKTDGIFCHIIGNDVRGQEFSNNCLKSIKNQSLITEIEKYKKNDLYGSPPLYKTEITNNISSGTCYFLSILDRILTHFGDIKNFNICEIGSGYGGQANVINMYGVKSYTCIDNISTLNLAKKYNNLFGNKINYYDTDMIPVDQEYDLVISNWCLSEFDITGMKFYIDNIISKSKNGYFEMNIWDQERKNFILEEIKKHFSKVIIYEEPLKTNPNNNFLLICSKE